MHICKLDAFSSHTYKYLNAICSLDAVYTYNYKYLGEVYPLNAVSTHTNIWVQYADFYSNL